MDEIKIRIDLGGPSPEEFPVTIVGSRERLERILPQLRALVQSAKSVFDQSPTVSEATPCKGCGKD